MQNLVDSSQPGPEEFFNHMRLRCLVLLFLKIMLNGTDTRSSFVYCFFFPLVPSPSVYWVLLSELREIVRHKPPSLVIRKGAMLST